MSKKTIADQLIDTLALAGVKRVYGVAGDSLNGITDSIRRGNDIKWVSMRHGEMLTAAESRSWRSPLTFRAARSAAGSDGRDPEQVRPMLVDAMNHDGPALVDVVVNRQELAMPPSIDRAQMVGCSLYMIKAVLNGRGDEIIDLAKTNVFR